MVVRDFDLGQVKITKSQGMISMVSNLSELSIVNKAGNIRNNNFRV